MLYVGKYAEPLAADIQAAGEQLRACWAAAGLPSSGLHLPPPGTFADCYPTLCLHVTLTRAGGIITTVDLASAAPVISEPLRCACWPLRCSLADAAAASAPADLSAGWPTCPAALNAYIAAGGTFGAWTGSAPRHPAVLLPCLLRWRSWQVGFALLWLPPLVWGSCQCCWRYDCCQHIAVVACTACHFKCPCSVSQWAAALHCGGAAYAYIYI